MKKIISYMLDQKLLVNLMVVMVLFVGIAGFSGLNRESSPQATLDMVTIATVYPGASPNEAEELICVPVEKKLRSVSGIDKVRTYNVENVSLTVVFLDEKASDRKKIVQDIKDAIEQINNLPSMAQKPLVSEVTFDNTELVSIAFTGKNKDVPYSKLRDFATQSENFFYDIDGVAEVQKFGYYDREYLVEVNPEALERYRIGLNTLVTKLKMRNIDFPGGALRVGKKEFVLRTKGQFKNADEIRSTPIMGNDTGYMLKVGDLAKVTDTYEEADVHHRLNGKEAIIFKVLKKRSADEIDLSTRMRAKLAAYSLPGYEDIEITQFNDISNQTRTRLSAVIEEAALGSIILGIFMFLLLGRRMSLLVLSGIPVTFLVTFASMRYMGLTINIVTLFGMIMVMGMMVDFSIVVAENSHQYLEKGLKRRLAVENGVSEVFWSVTVTLICIAAAFTPLLLLTGMMGKFIIGIPIVIISALLASWFIAMFILPTFLNMFLGDSHKKRVREEKTIPQKLWTRMFGEERSAVKKKRAKEDPNLEGGLFRRVQLGYKSFVTLALTHRYKTVGILVGLFAVTIFLIPALGFKFMTEGGEAQIRIKVQLPFESNLAANLEETKKLEKIVLDTLKKDELKTLHLYAGETYTDMIDPRPGKATFKSTFELYLTPEKDRKRLAREINEALRSKIVKAQSAGILSKDTVYKVDSIMQAPPIGKPVNIEIRGADFAVLEKIAKEYTDFLHTQKGVRDISIDLEKGKTEYRYTVNERMAAVTGVSAYDIGEALNTSFSGSVATKVNQNQEEVGVRVRLDEESRKKMNGLQDVKIANRTGGLVSLDSVSNVNIDQGFSQINHLNFKRIIQVQADLDSAVLTPGAATTMLQNKFADIGKRYPGYSITYGGEQEDTNKSMGQLGLYFGAALLFIFIVLTVFFRSLSMPLVVMIAIPFALVGVVIALFIHGQPFSFMSVLGLLSLAGIIVSNTLVLVQFINKFRDEGMPLKDALIEGGVVRLRPIILTSGSMILELIPVMYGFGGKDYMISPLALAFGWGLLFATFITLILIPCFYYIAEDIKGFAADKLLRFGIEMSPTIYQPAIKTRK